MGDMFASKKTTLGQSQGKWWYNWNGLIIINQPHMPYVIPRVPPYFHNIFSHLGRWKQNRGDACIAFSISRSFASFFAFLSWSVSCCTHRSEIRLYNHLSSEWNSKNWDIDILLISTGARWTSQPSTVSLGAIFTGAFFATFFSIFFSFLAAFRKPEVSFKKKRSVQLEFIISSKSRNSNGPRSRPGATNIYKRLAFLAFLSFFLSFLSFFSIFASSSSADWCADLTKKHHRTWKKYLKWRFSPIYISFM